MYTQAYAFGPKVNSLLSESSLSACKTWMLLQVRTLCILRYTRGVQGESKDQGQACAGANEGEGRRVCCYSSLTSSPSRAAGHLAQVPEIQTPPNLRATRPTPPARTSGHPALRKHPDIRPVALTSGLPCLRAVHLGRGPCTPSPLRLYILPLHVLGLALV